MKLINLKKYKIQDFLGKEIDCDCGRKHSVNIDDIVIEKNAINSLPILIKKNNFKKVFIIADVNTYKAAGKIVESTISGWEFDVKRYIFKGNGC